MYNSHLYLVLVAVPCAFINLDAKRVALIQTGRKTVGVVAAVGRKPCSEQFAVFSLLYSYYDSVLKVPCASFFALQSLGRLERQF